MVGRNRHNIPIWHWLMERPLEESQDVQRFPISFMETLSMRDSISRCAKHHGWSLALSLLFFPRNPLVHASSMGATWYHWSLWQGPSLDKRSRLWWTTAIETSSIMFHFEMEKVSEKKHTKIQSMCWATYGPCEHRNVNMTCPAGYDISDTQFNIGPYETYLSLNHYASLISFHGDVSNVTSHTTIRIPSGCWDSFV